MDLSSLASTLLSSDTIKTLSKRTDVSQKDVTSVLSAALPLLLDGADKQAQDEGSGFASALKKHAANDTGDIGSFLGSVDLADGAKIIGHLLGSSNDSQTKKIAKDTGVSAEKTGTVLSAAAPLLMSLLGQQTEKEESGLSVGSLVGTLLGNVDVGSLIGGLLGADTAEPAAKKSAAKASTAKKSTAKASTAKKSSSKKKADSSDVLTDVVGAVLENVDVGDLLGSLLK